MPSLRAIEVFVAIAEESSLTRAAQRLFMTQPAVSHQISTLESELGVVLLDRGRRGVTLTTAGRAFLGPAREVLAAVDKAVTAAQAGPGEEPVRMIVAESFTVPLVAPGLSEWRARGHRLPVLTETVSADDAVAQVRAGRQDLALVPELPDRAGLRSWPVIEEEVVVTGPADHPLLRRPLRLEALAGEQLVGVEAEHGFASWWSAQLKQAGVLDVAAQRTRSIRSAAALAVAGFGLAVVPESALVPAAARTSLVPRLTRRVVAVGRSAGNGELERLVTVLRGAALEAFARSASVSGSDGRTGSSRK